MPENRVPPPEELAVLSWLEAEKVAVEGLERLAGDVSLRVYFRITLAGGSDSRIVAWYPPAIAAAQRRFSRAAVLLERVGIRVPRIERDDLEAGVSLLEDLGRVTLYDLSTSWEARPVELAAALELLPALASIPTAAASALGSPPLDAGLLRAELGRTSDLVLAPRGLAGAEIDVALDELCRQLGTPPLVACHRDLMARNLVPAGDRLAVLDFQDLRLGPAAYDLASLLNDSLFAGPATERAALDRFFPEAAGRTQYRRAVVQRSLKAIGTFVAFAQRGDRRHLALVGPTLGRAEGAVVALPKVESAPLVRVLERLRAAFVSEGLC